MHGLIAAWLVICLLLSSDKLVNSKTGRTGLARQSRFFHQVSETRSHLKNRQTRQAGETIEKQCRYQIALLDFPPYIMNTRTQMGFMQGIIKWFVDFWCFEREDEDPEAYIMKTIFVKSPGEMVELIKNKTVDFAFPIQADAKAELKDEPDVTLIRAFVSTWCSMIVNTKQCEAESREQLLTSITSQWPILACIILLSGISGVIIWLLERRAKKGQFSPSFTSGTPEGFWWAVLSLTTVGYGDVTPKSFIGRIFGIVWVLVGAVMMSLFTAAIINAMQATLDGTKCKEIHDKEIGVLAHNTVINKLVTEFQGKKILFASLKEMQRNLSEGIIGRVLVDRNTAFHFLDTSGLKRNRQIRLIRNIDYPLDYYLAHVSRELPLAPSKSPNDTDESDSDLAQRKEQLAVCGPLLKENSVDLISVSKSTAQEQLISAELQTLKFAGLFSTGSEMTSNMDVLFYLMGILFALIFIGILFEVYTRLYTRIMKRRKVLQHKSHDGFVIRLDNKMPADSLQYLANLEERLKESISVDIQKMKVEIIFVVLQQRRHDGFLSCLDNKIPAEMMQYLADLEVRLKDSLTVDVQTMKEELETSFTKQDHEHEYTLM